LDIGEANARHEGDLLRLPNVIGVGIGMRGTDPIIKVFVTRKLPREALGADELIPETLEGYPISVDAVGAVTAGSKDDDNGELDDNGEKEKRDGS